VETGSTLEICFASARETAQLIRAKKLSARELMAAHLERIGRLNPLLNAIVAKLDDAACMKLADEADRRLATSGPIGCLHGLPWAFKDLETVVGFPCTQGSPIYRDYYPKTDSVLVERLRLAGVLPIGMTNAPEFGMGSQTYNNVYGTTRNAWNRDKTSGGSSGGAAVSVASGMLPCADGSDLGGSLRNPANFNNIIGFRPSVGLVPTAPTQLPFLGFAVKGPLARSVADVAFLLSVMAGADARDPACYPSEPGIFAGSLERAFRQVPVAWCPDLGGLPLDPRVRSTMEAQRKTFESLGCIVEDACPDLSGAEEVFLRLRAWRSWHRLGPLLRSHRDDLTPEAIAEIESGARLTAEDIGNAMIRHGEILASMRQFQDSYPFLICAVNQVPPFDAATHLPTQIVDVTMEHYIAWMKSAYWITTTFCPAISVPAGFTEDGLPVGIQIVGRYRDDLGVLQLANAFESETGFGRRRPLEIVSHSISPRWHPGSYATQEPEQRSHSRR
jgi:amidase